MTTPWPMFHGSPSHTGVNFFERTLGVNEIDGLHLACAGSSYPATASFSSPAIWSGRAIIGTTDGHVIAFDSTDCAIRWTAPVGQPVYSSPAVMSGRVIVGTLGGGVYALDARTGAVAWHNALPGTFFGSATPSGGRAFIGTGEGTMYALDVATGDVRWSRSPGSRGGFDRLPAVVGGRVYRRRLDRAPPRVARIDGQAALDRHRPGPGRRVSGCARRRRLRRWHGRAVRLRGCDRQEGVVSAGRPGGEPRRVIPRRRQRLRVRAHP